MLYEVITPAAEIVSLDVPGAGEFFQQESPMSISSYVDRLKEDLFKKSQLKGKTKTIMIAISLGAMIARITSYNVCYTKLLRVAACWGGIKFE